jgi:hypothetical protein
MEEKQSLWDMLGAIGDGILKIICVVCVWGFVILLVYCIADWAKPTAHQEGRDAGRAAVRAARAEPTSAVGRTLNETILQTAPMIPPPRGKSPDWQAGYREGYMDELKKP